MKQTLKRLAEFSILKTMRLNARYFGMGGAFHPVILVSRNFKIRNLEGKVIAEDQSVGAIRIGFQVAGFADGKKERAVWDNRGTIHFRGKAFLGSGVKISNSGKIVIGDNLFISANTALVCRKEILIGTNSTVSWDCLLMDSDFHSIIDMEDNRQINHDEPICLEDHVWIGCRTMILKGGHVPHNSMVAAGSKVTKRLPDAHTLYGGNNIIKNNIDWR